MQAFCQKQRCGPLKPNSAHIDKIAREKTNILTCLNEPHQHRPASAASSLLAAASFRRGMGREIFCPACKIQDAVVQFKRSILTHKNLKN